MKSRLAIIANTSWPLSSFLQAQLAELARVYQLTIFLGADQADTPWAPRDTKVVSIPIRREVSLFRDVWVLARLWRSLKNGSFAGVISIQPKAGLLGMTAASLARIPVRIHFFTGQIWATRTGLSRAILRLADRVIARSMTHGLIDSPSQRDFLIEQRVVQPVKTLVIGHGSVGGVDTKRFCPNPSARTQVREALGIPSESPVVLFVGRLNRDKGVPLLIEAFIDLHRKVPNAWLLLVGPDEQGVMNHPRLKELNNVCHVGFTTEPERYMAAADVLCLPSFREGFGSVIIEAAATGIPAVASRIYGIADAVDDGKTGLLHEAGNAQDLLACLTELLTNAALRLDLGARARERASQYFAQDVVTSLSVAFVKSVIAP